MKYDYSKLAGRITEKFKTQLRFADAMGLSERTISLKLNGKIGWRQAEIEKACEILEIPHGEIGTYFFTKVTQSA